MRKLKYVLVAALALLTAGAQNSTAEAQNSPIQKYLEKDAFIRVQKKLRPSVVRIETKQIVPGNFGRESYVEENSGTGFIVTKEGHVLTNAHVVLDTTEINVIIHDGKKFKPKILGYDQKSDLAMIKINAPYNFTPAELGDSAKIEVGTIVVAMGNALGHGINVSIGIVSAYGFPEDVIERYKRKGHDSPPPIDWIITDAGINPGNSGGPLVELDGSVIGINSMKFNADNMSITIPINYAKDVMETLKRGKPLRDSWIGALADYPPPEIEEMFKIPKIAGVLITKIVPGGPAEKSGLRRNDFVVGINGKPVANVRDFEWSIRVAREKVTLRLYRLGKEMTVIVPVVSEPENDDSNAGSKSKPSYNDLKPKR